MVYGGGQVLAGQRVLNQTCCHTDSSQAKAEVETAGAPAPTGQNRADECTGVHADVEDGEARVAAVVVVRVEGADQHGGITLQTTGADSDQQQTNHHTRNAGDEGEGDVARHDADSGVEEGTLGAEEAVTEDTAEDCHEVHDCTVCADNAGGEVLVEAQAALVGGVVQVVNHDALHAVEGEALPHFYGEQVREHARVAEEGLGVLGFGTCDGVRHGGNSFLCKPGVLCDPGNMCLSLYPYRCICIHGVCLYFKD